MAPPVTAAPEAEHHTVYRDDEEFSAWPFNAGLWQVDEEELVAACFTHDCDYGVAGNLEHKRIDTYGRIQATRTTDGGRTWREDGEVCDFVETSADVQYGPERSLEPVDFAAPETFLASWSATNFADPEARPWIRVSADAGRSWSPPVALPTHVFERIQGRPCYVTRGDGDVLLFLTAQAADDPHYRPVVYASRDGGRNWTFVSYVGGSDDYAMICPSPAVLGDGRLVAAVRCHPVAWSELYVSADEGRTWSFASRINDTGAPTNLTVLADGRLLAVYGYRRPPYGIRARLSDDGGETWGAELVLRDDGANRDLGYPRAKEVGDGEVLVTYYFNEAEDDVPADGGVRHVAATRFRPPPA